MLERDGRIAGAVLGRQGRNATQVGPIVAQDEAAAIALLRHAVGRIAGAVFIDALDAHAGLAAAIEQAGFTRQRTYTRMAWRTDAIPGEPARYFAAAGPELG